jgi:hypothetical protein
MRVNITNRYSGLFVLFFLSTQLWSQEPLKVVQFSGRTFAIEDDRLINLIYTNVAVAGTSRGTSSDIDGFFSIAVAEGEKVLFTRIGYQTVEFVIPENVQDNLFSKDILMKRDTLFLPEALILPWPDKDYFKIEFLALELDRTLEDLAQENLDPETMQMLTEILPVDGGEVSKLELRQAAQGYYYLGQARPQNIFNPLSWKKFIDAIKRGDYKKKD